MLIDYSILLGISEDDSVNCLTIIDYMQKYTCLKRIEHFMKSILTLCNRESFSSVNAAVYYKQFLNFALNIPLFT